MSKARRVLEVHSLSKIIATLEALTPAERERTLAFVNSWADEQQLPRLGAPTNADE